MTGPRLRLSAVAAVFLALTGMLAGCGLPPDDEPRTLSADDVPFELLEPQPTSTVTTAPNRPGAVVTAYLISGDRLVPVFRHVDSPVTAGRLLRVLIEGPTEEEAATGLRTAISTETRIDQIAVDGGVATVELSREFVEVTGPEQILAIAQIVFTATESQASDSVRFRLSGEPVEVPKGDGTLTSAPLTRADYAALRPA